MTRMTIDYVQFVEIFMQKYNQTIRFKPEIPTEQEEDLRLRLIDEELNELRGAIVERDLVGIADALADTLYVVFGTASAYGIPIADVFIEVHRSNMTKPFLGHDERGKKVQKGNYSKPNVAGIIEACK
jgi:NTP pyrophosphatase (non-canonical NTP hydrolase)